MIADFVQAVAITTGGGVGRDVEQGGDPIKGEAFPELEMEDGALVGGELGKGGLKGVAKRLFIRIRAGVEQGNAGTGFGMDAFAGLATSGEIEELVAGHAEEKAAGIACVVEEVGPFHQLAPQLLKHIGGIGLGSGDLKEEAVDRIAMGMEEVMKICHVRMGRTRVGLGFVQ